MYFCKSYWSIFGSHRWLSYVIGNFVKADVMQRKSKTQTVFRRQPLKKISTKTQIQFVKNNTPYETTYGKWILKKMKIGI